MHPRGGGRLSSLAPGRMRQDKRRDCKPATCRGMGGWGAVPEAGLLSMGSPPPPQGASLVNRRIRLSEQPLQAFHDDRLGQFGPFGTSRRLSVVVVTPPCHPEPTLTSTAQCPVWVSRGQAEVTCPSRCGPSPRAPVRSAPSRSTHRSAPHCGPCQPWDREGLLPPTFHRSSPRSELRSGGRQGRGTGGQLTPGTGPKRAGSRSFFGPVRAGHS